MNYNKILASDSYKYSHWLQYTPGTDWMMSYFESRGGEVFKDTLFFGLQSFIKDFLLSVPSTADIMEASWFMSQHGEPFNFDGWVKLKELGYWPAKIRAVREGTVVQKNNVLLTIESTHPELFWVVSWLETVISRLWYPINVASLGYHIKKDLIIPSLWKTSDVDPEVASLFMLHDFGARGVSSEESAAIGGMAHLVNFMGSDTCAGIAKAMADYTKTAEPRIMPGFSIPASEHSTVTMWGRNGEKDALKNMIDKYGKPGKLFAFVSDSYDIFNCIKNVWGDHEIKEMLIKSGAKGVVRPDSGHPPTMTVECLNLLGEVYGYTTNTKGYKVLPPCIGLIYGDGINYDSISEILNATEKAGWATSNVVFGMGGALLQHHNRDTHKMAFKCCAARINGKLVEIFKEPKSDLGKRSKKGVLDLVMDYDTHRFKTITREFDKIPSDSALVTVFENGSLLQEYSFEEIRTNARSYVFPVGLSSTVS